MKSQHTQANKFSTLDVAETHTRYYTPDRRIKRPVEHRHDARTLLNYSQVEANQKADRLIKKKILLGRNRRFPKNFFGDDKQYLTINVNLTDRPGIDSAQKNTPHFNDMPLKHIRSLTEQPEQQTREPTIEPRQFQTERKTFPDMPESRSMELRYMSKKQKTINKLSTDEVAEFGQLLKTLLHKKIKEPFGETFQKKTRSSALPPIILKFRKNHSNI